MFGLGWMEIIVIALILLIFVGPKNLPAMLRKAGSLMNEFKTASRDLRNQLEAEAKAMDLESPATIVKDAIKDMPSPYEEIQKAEEKIQKDIKETMSPIAQDIKKPMADMKNSIQTNDSKQNEKEPKDEEIQ